MEGRQWDHVLIRVKDVIIIGAAMIAIILWVGDFWGMPIRVEANEKSAQDYREYKAQQDIVITEIRKDIGYLRIESDKQSKTLYEILEKLNK